MKIPTLFLAALCLMAQPLSALTFGKFTYYDNGTSITISSYPTSETGAVVIPSTIAGKPVTSIGDNTFGYCNGLTSVTIPSNVTSIGNYAFTACTSLTSVTIPSSVISIGYSAFYGCSVLTSVTIPSGVPSIGWRAFGYCRSLTSVTIPSIVTSIGDQAFVGCSGLTGVTIPSGVTTIGVFSFYSCTSLTSVSIPPSVTSIGNQAFNSCSGLTVARFLGNAPTMGSYIFDNTAPDFKINYIKGKTGFTSPTWLGYPCVGVAAPEIDVQYPAGTSLVDGTSKKSFGTVVVGLSSTAKTFTIKNTGTANLTGLWVSKDGANAGNFLITQPAKTTLLPGTSITFKVTFKPTASGTRNAAIHIKSNDANENPFDIQLTGLAVAP